MSKKLTDIAAEAIGEATDHVDPKKALEEINDYLRKNPVPDSEIRHADYPAESHIDSMSVEDLENLVMQDGANFIDSDGNLGILSAYSSLIKLRNAQQILIEKGIECRDDDNKWVEKIDDLLQN